VKLPAYPEYERSGIEWLGKVPEHWKVDRIKWSVVGCFNGIWGDEPEGIEDIICVRVADFDRERLTVVGEPPTLRAVAFNQRMTRILHKGDLLIEKSGGGEKQLVGCVVYFNHDFEAVCSNFVARMPVAAGMHPRFWTYVHSALYAARVNYLSIKQTTGIQNLDSSSYLNEKVGYPSIHEQRTIADFLDAEAVRLDTLVTKKRELIEKLKEKRSALISHTVTRGLPPEAVRAAGLKPNPKLKPNGSARFQKIGRLSELVEK
jgi:type I restriction enzyme, S subunit